jgi:hypothetical protein
MWIGHVLGSRRIKGLDDPRATSPSGNLFAGRCAGFDAEPRQVGGQRIGDIHHHFATQVPGLLDRVPRCRPGDGQDHDLTESSGLCHAAGVHLAAYVLQKTLNLLTSPVTHAEQDLVASRSPGPAKPTAHVSRSNYSDFHRL